MTLGMDVGLSAAGTGDTVEIFSLGLLALVAASEVEEGEKNETGTYRVGGGDHETRDQKLGI